ncbi:MAG: PucR family transcriptional regulator [Actinomycetota bacterium]
MPITLRELLDIPDLGLKVVAGEAGLDRHIRWVHTSELLDPTPWLRGGELLLTTGMQLRNFPSIHRRYVQRLATAGLAGLGFGVGFDFRRTPPAVIKSADKEGFCVLEVPYEVPFIALSEAVSSRLAEDRLREAQTSVEINERLTLLLAEGAGPADVLDEVGDLTGGWALLYDLRGQVLASSAGAPVARTIWDGLPEEVRTGRHFSTSSQLGPTGRKVAVPVVAAKRAEGVFVFGKAEVTDRDRIVMHHAATVLGLLLASRRAIVETERRVAGDILNEAFAGRLSDDELVRRLELVGFQPAAALTVLVVEGINLADSSTLDDLLWTADTSLGSRCRAVRVSLVGARIAALVDTPRPRALGEALLTDLDARVASGKLPSRLRVGVGETVEPASIRRSFLTAVFSLRAAGEEARIHSPADLGTYGLLLAAQSRPVLETFVRSVLGPLIDHDSERGSELVVSVRAFVASGGRWEEGAKALGVHRHTLRYRINQASDLTGRDFSRADDRFDVWLALKALDVLEW